MFTTKAESAIYRILVFAIGKLYVAVPLEEVLKVTTLPEIFQSGEKTLGVTHFEDKEVLVVDLYHEIYGGSSSTSGRYLLVMQDPSQSLYGIPLSGLPTMKELPLKAVHPIPDEYRDRDTLGIASHMVQIPMGKEVQTIFLLSSEKLIEIVRSQK